MIRTKSHPLLPSHLLHEMLSANLQLPPEYRGQLSNHLPMALHALQGLGASPQRMQDFYAGYARRFQGLPVPPPAPPVLDWRPLCGQADAWAPLLASFSQALTRDGTDAVLRQALPVLLPGVAAAAFHGLIRTAHAVESGHQGELAAALAYWAWRWQALPAPPPATEPLPLARWSARLIERAAGWRGDGALIAIRMQQASQSTVYLELAAALRPAPDAGAQLAELAALALERYVASRNFTVLHMITGLRALRRLLPWVAEPQALQPVLLRAMTAAYLAAGVDPLAPAPVAPPRSWPQVVAAAIASDDEHVIKLVHACREEAQIYGEGRYLQAAALAVA